MLVGVVWFDQAKHVGNVGAALSKNLFLKVWSITLSIR